MWEGTLLNIGNECILKLRNFPVEHRLDLWIVVSKFNCLNEDINPADLLVSFEGIRPVVVLCVEGKLVVHDSVFGNITDNNASTAHGHQARTKEQGIHTLHKGIKIEGHSVHITGEVGMVELRPLVCKVRNDLFFGVLVGIHCVGFRLPGV